MVNIKEHSRRVIKLWGNFTARRGYKTKIPSFEHLMTCRSIHHLKIERVWHSCKPTKHMAVNQNGYIPYANAAHQPEDTMSTVGYGHIRFTLCGKTWKGLLDMNVFAKTMNSEKQSRVPKIISNTFCITTSTCLPPCSGESTMLGKVEASFTQLWNTGMACYLTWAVCVWIALPICMSRGFSPECKNCCLYLMFLLHGRTLYNQSRCGGMQTKHRCLLICRQNSFRLHCIRISFLYSGHSMINLLKASCISNPKLTPDALQVINNIFGTETITWKGKTVSRQNFSLPTCPHSSTQIFLIKHNVLRPSSRPVWISNNWASKHTFSQIKHANRQRCQETAVWPADQDWGALPANPIMSARHQTPVLLGSR